MNPSRSQFAFPRRGVKGLWWEAEAYREVAPLLAPAGFNFYFLCYTLCPESSLRWRDPYRPPELALARDLTAALEPAGVEVCLAINPCIGRQAWRPANAGVRYHSTLGEGWFSRYWQERRPAETMACPPSSPVEFGSAEDLELLLAKCRAMQAEGVRSFALCLDDVEPSLSPADQARFGSLAAAQGQLAGLLAEGLGTARGEVRLYLCPTYYWTEGAQAHRGYLEELGRRLPPEVEVFWTGPTVRAQRFGAAEADAYGAALGRAPFLWLNYASNDSHRWHLPLPPAPPPDPDLAGHVTGLLANLCRQVEVAKVHLATLAPFLQDPKGFSYAEALEGALRLAGGQEGGPALGHFARLWATYPSLSGLGGGDPAGALAALAPVEGLRAEVSGLLPELERRLRPPLYRELATAAGRLERLAAAVKLGRAVLAGEPEARGRAEEMRNRLLAVPEEISADALAVLGRVVGAQQS